MIETSNDSFIQTDGNWLAQKKEQGPIGNE
jgi:hypothetical protein